MQAGLGLNSNTSGDILWVWDPFLFSFYYLLQSGNITHTYTHVRCELTHMHRMRSMTTTPPHHDPHAHVADVEDALVYHPPTQRHHLHQ